MYLPAIDPQKLPDETVERRLTYAKYSEDPEILRALSCDSFWFVRDYTAANIHTPEDCLRNLMMDPDFRIRGEAERTLKRQGRVDKEPEQRKPPLHSQIESAAFRASDPIFESAPEHSHSL